MNKNKVDEYLLWKQWMATKDEEKLNQLFDSFQPLIHDATNKFRYAPIPTEAIDLEAKRLFHRGLQTYDPTKGAKLNTHLFNQMKPLYRYVAKNQNISYIPEVRVRQIGTYKFTLQELREKLGRQPNASEVADSMGVDIGEITRLQKELRHQDITGLEDFEGYFISPSKKLNALYYVYNDLGPKQKLVFEHLTGLTGKEKLGTSSAIARQINEPVKKVRTMRTEIGKRLEPFADID